MNEQIENSEKMENIEISAAQKINDYIAGLQKKRPQQRLLRSPELVASLKEAAQNKRDRKNLKRLNQK